MCRYLKPPEPCEGSSPARPLDDVHMAVDAHRRMQRPLDGSTAKLNVRLSASDDWTWLAARGLVLTPVPRGPRLRHGATSSRGTPARLHVRVLQLWYPCPTYKVAWDPAHAHPGAYRSCAGYGGVGPAAGGLQTAVARHVLRSSLS